ncbi:MAG: SDR family oxidoreductase [Acidobacteria bacterium]|nr:SDR family oxidoreductase [Acidobacteriota bacterium]MBP7474064.1 SDR family oxidoreductase [Pyrinomonadaceae bacterium]MBP9109917.1 SDR family oxidoreductase [Pyrinomonadaceae bacterium]
MDLEGKTCLVIGAGRGIGRRVAELFSKAGANIVISSRTESDLLELEYQLNSEGNSNVLVAVADAANEGDARQIVSRAAERFGSVDYLIHAAGLGVLKPFSELNNSDLDAMLNANVRSAFNIFQAVLPLMSERKFGRVVAFPGILGKAPMMQASGYCAAKYALTGMVKCLAQEYKRFGIRFSLMHLGGVDSSFWDDITMRVDRTKMLSVDAAAQAAFFAATQEGEGVMAEVVLMPESHQLV